MSKLTSYVTAQDTINQPAEQAAGQVVRLLTVIRDNQAQAADAITQIGTIISTDNERETPLLDSTTRTELAAQLALTKDGGTLINNKVAIGFDVLSSMVDGVDTAIPA